MRLITITIYKLTKLISLAVTNWESAREYIEHFLDSNKYIFAIPSTVHNTQHLYLCRVDCMPCRISIIILNPQYVYILVVYCVVCCTGPISLYKLFSDARTEKWVEEAFTRRSFSLMFSGRRKKEADWCYSSWVSAGSWVWLRTTIPTFLMERLTGQWTIKAGI